MLCVIPPPRVVVWDLDDTIVPWSQDRPDAPLAAALHEACVSYLAIGLLPERGAFLRLASRRQQQWMHAVRRAMHATPDVAHHIVSTAQTAHVHVCVHALDIPVPLHSCHSATVTGKSAVFARLAAVDFSHLSPDRVVAVSDSTMDINAARRCGWHVVRVDPRDERTLRAACAAVAGPRAAA